MMWYAQHLPLLTSRVQDKLQENPEHWTEIAASDNIGCNRRSKRRNYNNKVATGANQEPDDDRRDDDNTDVKQLHREAPELHCIPTCAYGQHSEDKPMLRCIICMKWFHNTCCQETEAFEGSWTCLSCRQITTKLDRILEEIESYHTINQELLQMLQAKTQECETLKQQVTHGATDRQPDTPPQETKSSDDDDSDVTSSDEDSDDKSSSDSSSSDDGEGVEPAMQPHSHSTPKLAEKPAWQIVAEAEAAAAAENGQLNQRDGPAITVEDSLLFQRQRRARKREARKSRRAKTTAGERARQSRMKVTVLCDSVPKDLPEGIISQDTTSDVHVDHKAATIEAAVEYIQNMRKEPRDGIIIHTGTNHVVNDSEDNIRRKLRRLETNLKNNQPKHVAISSIVHRKSGASVMCKVLAVNTAIKDMCQRNSWYYMDNDGIDWRCLEDSVHLNGQGMLKMMGNVASTIRSFTKVTSTKAL